MTSGNSQPRTDEVTEVLSLIQDEAGSATLMLIAVVTTPSVKLLEEKCRQLLPEQHIIITTIDQLENAIKTRATQSTIAKRLTILVSSRFSRISLQVPERFQKLALVPTGRRRHGLPLRVQEDSTFCDIPLHSWVTRTMYKDHEFIIREGICLVTGMASMMEQASASTSTAVSDDVANAIRKNIDSLGRDVDAWETESQDTDPEKTSDEETDEEKIEEESGSEPGIARPEGIGSRQNGTRERSPPRSTQQTRTNPSTPREEPSFWEKWKATIAAIVGALAGVSSGAAFLTMTAKGIYINVAGFTIIAAKLNLTAACVATVASIGGGVLVGLAAAAAIYFIPWGKVFTYLGNTLRWLGEKLAAIWARYRSRNAQRRRARMPMRI